MSVTAKNKQKNPSRKNKEPRNMTQADILKEIQIIFQAEGKLSQM